MLFMFLAFCYEEEENGIVLARSVHFASKVSMYEGFFVRYPEIRFGVSEGEIPVYRYK